MGQWLPIKPCIDIYSLLCLWYGCAIIGSNYKQQTLLFAICPTFEFLSRVVVGRRHSDGKWDMKWPFS